MGHLKMMAATQPFLSGAISKTVNLPQDCTVEDIAETYLEAWRQGIKAVAIYRDNSKGAQPLNVSTDADKKKDADEKAALAASAEPGAPRLDSETWVQTTTKLATVTEQAATAQLQVAALEAQLKALTAQSLANADAHDSTAPPRAVRHRLPAERASVTHKFGLGGHEGYITVGLYPNGQPGEIFIRMAKEGSTVSGLMDSFATAVSLSLQHGVPLKVLCEKFAHTRFEPSGWTGNEQIGYAKSIMDYLFRWIELRFLQGTQLDLFANLSPQKEPAAATIPVHGHVSAPANTVVSNAPTTLSSREHNLSSPKTLSSSEGGSAFASSLDDHDSLYDRTAPQGGIAPDLQARSGLTNNQQPITNNLSMEDRGIYHTAQALRSVVNMGDAPSCATCGAIMTRNGSCYRCGECGSTSGCS